MASVHARAPLGASNSRSKIESEHENPTQRSGPAPPYHRVHARRPAVNNQPLGSRRLVHGAPRGASSPLDDPADDLAPSRLRRAADRRTPPDHTAEHSTRSQPDQAVRPPSHTEPTFSSNYYALLADLPLDSPPVRPKTQCTNNTGRTPNTPPHTPLKCSDSEVHIPPHPTSTTTSTAPDSTFIDSSSSKRKHSSSASASDSNHSRDRLKYRRKKKKRKNDLPQGRKRIQHPTVESSILPLPLRPKLDAQQPSITQTQPAPTPTLPTPEDTYSSATRAEAALPSPPSVSVDEPPSTTRVEPASTPTLPVPVDEPPSATRDETAFSPSTAAPTCTLPFATRDEPASTPIPPAPPPAPDGEPPSATCDDQVPIPSPPTLEVSQPYIAQEEEAPTPPCLHTHVTRATHQRAGGLLA